MRKIVAGFKTSVDGKIEASDHFADWVEAWSEDYGLSSQIDACLLGGGMYPGYESYWSAIQQNDPDQPLPMTGKLSLPSELRWARFAALTPHYVLSKSLKSALWPNTRFLREINDVAALKHQPGKDIYLMGGAGITSNLIDAGLVDELRLIVYPLIAGRGKALFENVAQRRGLELRNIERLQDGRLSLHYVVN